MHIRVRAQGSILLGLYFIYCSCLVVCKAGLVGVSYFFRSTHRLCCMCFMLQCTIQKVHTFGLMCSRKLNAFFALLPMFSTQTKSLKPTSMFRIMASRCFPPKRSHLQPTNYFQLVQSHMQNNFFAKKEGSIFVGQNWQIIQIMYNPYALHFQVRSLTTIIL